MCWLREPVVRADSGRSSAPAILERHVPLRQFEVQRREARPLRQHPVHNCTERTASCGCLSTTRQRHRPGTKGTTSARSRNGMGEWEIGRKAGLERSPHVARKLSGPGDSCKSGLDRPPPEQRRNRAVFVRVGQIRQSLHDRGAQQTSRCTFRRFVRGYHDDLTVDRSV